MKFIRRLLSGLAITVGLAIAPAQADYQPGAVVQLPNVAAIASKNLLNTPYIYVAGYVFANDGGQGTFVQTSCTPDPGSCFADSAGHTFKRTNLDGSVQQWGLVRGSAYDCSATTGFGVSSCTAADSILTSLNSTVVANNIPVVSLGGMQPKVAASYTAPTNVRVDCGAQYLGNNNATGFYNDFPGTIYTAHTASLLHQAGSGYSNCIVEPTYYASALPWTTVRQQIDYWGQGGTAQTNGDVGVSCTVSTCNDSNLFILGYDNGLNTDHNSDGTYTNLQIDANVGVSAWHNLGGRRYSNINIFTFTTHSLNGISGTYNNSNSEWWTITNIVDDGTGQCAIQSTEHSLADIHTGDIISITNLGSREGCQGNWTVTVSGSNIVLNGSSFAGPTTTGTYVAGTNSITLASTANISHFGGQSITGVSGISNSSIVAAVDDIAGWVAITCDDAGGICITGNGSSISMQFANTTGAFNSRTCVNGASGTCMILSAQSRLVAGASPGGVKSGGIATGVMVGGALTTDKDAGADFSTIFTYSHKVQIHVENSNNVMFSPADADTDGTTNDPTQIGWLVDGDDDTVSFVGKETGKLGIGVIVNSTQSSQRCVHVIQSGITGFNAIQLDDGCADISGTHTTQGNIMVGNLTGPAIFNSNFQPNGNLYAQTAQALSQVNGGANVFASGYAAQVNNNTDSNKAATTGTITLGSPTISGSSFDTTGVQVGMNIIAPSKKDIPNGTEVAAVTAAPCTPSCTVTMTNNAKATDTGSFLFKGLYTPQAPIVGMQSRVIGQDGENSLNEIDAYGGNPGYICTRADGTLAGPTAVQSGDILCEFSAQGMGATVQSTKPTPGVAVTALENWTDSAQGSGLVVSPTEVGKIVQTEAARVESGGIGALSGAGILSPLYVKPTATIKTLNGINALGSSSTGAITFSPNVSGLPSPGLLYVDSELMSYQLTSSGSGITANITARGLFGTTGATHANGMLVPFVEQTNGNSTSAPAAFMVLSNGTILNDNIPITPNTSQINGAITPGTTTLALTNSNCGSIINAVSAGGTLAVTLPAAPALRCTFTFQPQLNNITIDPNGMLLARAYGNSQTSLLTLVSLGTNNQEQLTYQWNNANSTWSLGATTPILLSNTFPQSTPILAHGQVYFSYCVSSCGLGGALSAQFQLCPFNGPGGLISGGQMRQIPTGCIFWPASATTSSARNYFYVGSNISAIVTISNDGSGHVQLGISGLANFTTGNPISCYNATGTPLADVTNDYNTTVSGTNVVLSDVTYVASGTATCIWLTSAVVTNTHVMLNGVEVRNGTTGQTLVGMAYIGAANAVSDCTTPGTACDVASFFNRNLKKMVVALGANAATTTSATLKTPTTTAVQGEFVAWGPPTLPGTYPSSQIQWSITSSAANSNLAAVNTVGACFSATSPGTNASCANTPEVEVVTQTQHVANDNEAYTPSGITTTVTEGRNFANLLMDTGAGTLTMTQNATFLDVFLWQ